MTSRRSPDDYPSSFSRPPRERDTAGGGSPSSASAPLAPATTTEPPRPYSDNTSGGAADLGGTNPGFAGSSAVLGRGQDIFPVAGNVARPRQGQHQGQSPGARRAPGAVPISDLLSEDPSPRRRQLSVLTSGDDPQHAFGSALSSPGSTGSSPLSARARPSAGRRGFFDPARDFQNEDVSMTDAPALNSPYQTSFPAGRASGYPPASPAQGLSSGYDQASAPGSSAVEDRYRLVILQQPIAARACGHGERDRRVVDPPPILQLKLENYDPQSPDDVATLKSNFNIVQCLLYNAPGPGGGRRGSTAGAPGTEASDTGARRPTHGLMGALATSPFVGTDPAAPASGDPKSRIGAFYVFHDLSCRQPGRYRLHFSLTAVGPNLASPVPGGSHSRILAGAVSDVFEVFGAKDFPGMRPSSALTRELKRQGATVSVKKGSEGRNAQRQRRGSTAQAPAGASGLEPAEEQASASGSDDGSTMPPPPRPGGSGRGRGA